MGILTGCVRNGNSSGDVYEGNAKDRGRLKLYTPDGGIACRRPLRSLYIEGGNLYYTGGWHRNNAGRHSVYEYL